MAVSALLQYSCCLLVLLGGTTATNPDEVFCQCHVSSKRDANVAIHCSNKSVKTAALAATESRGGGTCERAVVPDLPHGYRFLPDYGLFKLYRTAKTWEDAKLMCHQDGARLAILPDHTAVQGARQLFGREPGIWYAFIGISDLQSEGIYMGVDGKPAPYLSWAQGEPNNKGDEDCIALDQNGFMNDFPCGQPAPFLCERPLHTAIPQEYRWIEDAGRFLRRHDHKLTYQEALEVCEGDNATLAVPDTWRRGEAILRLLDTTLQGYLVGFTDELVEGDFVTKAGRHMRDMEFRVWNKGEPNNHSDGKAENCVALLGVGYYNDVRCDREFPFICEIAPA